MEDSDEGEKWLRVAAEKGWAPAQYELGEVLIRSQDWIEDEAEANASVREGIELIRKAVDLQHGSAEGELGELLFLGMVEARLASESGGTGRFDIIEDSAGDISIYEDGYCHGGGYESVALAVKSAEEFASQYDRREIDELKRRWKNDPYWDIETTEGYEHFEQELHVYRLETELVWAKEREQRFRAIVAPFANLLKELAPAAV